MLRIFTFSPSLPHACQPTHSNQPLYPPSSSSSSTLYHPRLPPTFKMARNQEKAQSMLYRFREAQNAELGIGNRKDVRRPRLASSVKTIRECEKWRGEIMREISRKVSKIQDFGLTDYEVRDINDEINKLIREKGHWENQIVALGGANYKRGIPTMLGEDGGSEVPGGRGYKYFGRAKDLPGVKELFNRTAAQESELESYRSEKYKRFSNQPASYFGDLDEDDPTLLEAENSLEEKLWTEGVERVSTLLMKDVEELSNGKDGMDVDGQSRDEEELSKGLEKVKKELDLDPDRIPRDRAKSMKGLRKKHQLSSMAVLQKNKGRKIFEIQGAPKGPKGNQVVVEGAPKGPKKMEKGKGKGKRKAEDVMEEDGKRLKGQDGKIVEKGQEHEQDGEDEEMKNDEEEEEEEEEEAEEKKEKEEENDNEQEQDEVQEQEDSEMKDSSNQKIDGEKIASSSSSPSQAESKEGEQRKKSDSISESETMSTLFSVFDPQELVPNPKVMDRNDQERFLLESRKRALKREYIG